MRTRLLATLVIAGLMGTSPIFGMCLKFAPAGGAVWAVGEEIEESNFGYNFGGTIEIEIWKGFDYGLRYCYSDVETLIPNPLASDSTPETLDAEFIHHVFQLTNAWSPGWKWVDPYVRGCAGLYSWRQLDANGDLYEFMVVQDADTTINELAAASFGIGIGGGLRIWPTQVLGFRLGVDYDLIFSEGREKFGATDANENLLRVGGEVVFRIPLK